MSDSVDIFAPPEIPIEVSCLHCGRIYTSDLMIAVPIDRETHYMCPVPNCGAMGFLMDIFPTAEDYCDENGGFVSFDDDEEDVKEYSEEFLEDDETDLAYRPDHFEPAVEWSPDTDVDFGDKSGSFSDNESEFAPNFESASDEPFPRHLYFTREDYEAALAEGVYERAIAETRAQWQAIHDDGNLPFDENDIPF